MIDSNLIEEVVVTAWGYIDGIGQYDMELLNKLVSRVREEYINSFEFWEFLHHPPIANSPNTPLEHTPDPNITGTRVHIIIGIGIYIPEPITRIYANNFNLILL